MKKQELSVSEFKKIISKRETEASLQVRVCNFIKKKYPTVIFQCDLTSGMNLGEKVGGMNTRLRSSRGLPDLFIAKPWYDSNWPNEGSELKAHGLFIELKKEGIKLLKKDNVTPVDSHIAEQINILARLNDLGYEARFGIGYDNTVKIIEEYLG